MSPAGMPLAGAKVAFEMLFLTALKNYRLNARFATGNGTKFAAKMSPLEPSGPSKLNFRPSRLGDSPMHDAEI